MGLFPHRTLAAEEPDLVSVAVRPGLVDTDVRVLCTNSSHYSREFIHALQMQTDLRVKGADHGVELGDGRIKRAHAEGTLFRPEDLGYVIAALAVRASKELNGKFVSWDGKECEAFRRQ